MTARAIVAAALIAGAAACGHGAGGAGTTPANVATAASVTLGYAPPAVGDVWTDVRTQDVDVTIDAGGQQVPMTSSRSERRRMEVLAVTGGAVTGARITYELLSQSQRLAGTEQLGPSPIAGKTYVLEAGDPVQVTTDGGAPSADELAAVREAEQSFGKPDRMNKLLGGRTFTADEQVELPADEIAHAMGDDPQLTVDRLALTYRRPAGADAVFDLEMVLRSDRQGAAFVMTLSGTLELVAATGDLVDMQLAGPATMSGTMSATGTMRMGAHRTR